MLKTEEMLKKLKNLEVANEKMLKTGEMLKMLNCLGEKLTPHFFGGGGGGDQFPPGNLTFLTFLTFPLF